MSPDENRAGFDLYRQAIGSCDEAHRVNAVMFDDSDESFVLTYVDETVEPNVLYEYLLFGVDANRKPDSQASGWAWKSCGLAPLAIGRVRPGEPWGYEIESRCSNWCGPSAPLETIPFDLQGLLEIQGYADVILYGRIVWHEYDGALAYAEAWAPADCSITAVEKSPWGAIKSLYR